MFSDIFYLGILYLEALLPILFGRKLNLGFSFSLKTLLFPEKSTFQTKVNTIAKPEIESIIEKVFLLITDNWFFRWLKKSTKTPLSLQKKEETPRVILNNDLNQARVSCVNNNTSYLGQPKKKYLC